MDAHPVRSVVDAVNDNQSRKRSGSDAESAPKRHRHQADALGTADHAATDMPPCHCFLCIHNTATGAQLVPQQQPPLHTARFRYETLPATTLHTIGLAARTQGYAALLALVSDTVAAQMLEQCTPRARSGLLHYALAARDELSAARCAMIVTVPGTDGRCNVLANAFDEELYAYALGDFEHGVLDCVLDMTAEGHPSDVYGEKLVRHAIVRKSCSRLDELLMAMPNVADWPILNVPNHGNWTFSVCALAIREYINVQQFDRVLRALPHLVLNRLTIPPRGGKRNKDTEDAWSDLQYAVYCARGMLQPPSFEFTPALHNLMRIINTLVDAGSALDVRYNHGLDVGGRLDGFAGFPLNKPLPRYIIELIDCVDPKAYASLRKRMCAWIAARESDDSGFP